MYDVYAKYIRYIWYMCCKFSYVYYVRIYSILVRYICDIYCICHICLIASQVVFQISFAANSPAGTAQTKRLFAMTQRFSFLLLLFDLFRGVGKQNEPHSHLWQQLGLPKLPLNALINGLQRRRHLRDMLNDNASGFSVLEHCGQCQRSIECHMIEGESYEWP